MSASRERLVELYQKMLAAQEKGGGFDLSFKEISDAWGYSSKHPCQTYLPLLKEHGLVVSKQRGRKTYYRAVSKNGSKGD